MEWSAQAEIQGDTLSSEDGDGRSVGCLLQKTLFGNGLAVSRFGIMKSMEQVAVRCDT